MKTRERSLAWSEQTRRYEGSPRLLDHAFNSDVENAQIHTQRETDRKGREREREEERGRERGREREKSALVANQQGNDKEVWHQSIVVQQKSIPNLINDGQLDPMKEEFRHLQRESE